MDSDRSCTGWQRLGLVGALLGLLSACGASAGSMAALQARETTRLRGLQEQLTSLDARAAAPLGTPRHTSAEMQESRARVEHARAAVTERSAATSRLLAARLGVLGKLPRRVSSAAFHILDAEGEQLYRDARAAVGSLQEDVTALETQLYEHDRLATRVAFLASPRSTKEN